MLKINKKLIWSISACLILFHPDVNAQVAKEITARYPASVVYRLSGITSKVAIPVEKQRILAEYFQKQDKLANQALASGKNSDEISGYYTNRIAYLKTVLSPLELNDYEFNPENTENQLEKAIKYRQSLILGTEQVNDLLGARKTENAPQDNESEPTGNTTLAEGEKLTKVLSPSQYDKFLQLLVKPIALIQASTSWALLKKHGLVKPTDSVRINSENLQYFIRAGIMDARANNSELYLKIDSVRGTYFVYKPLDLWKLDMLNNQMPESQFATVITKRKLLKLSSRQVDSLLAVAAALEKIRAEYKTKVSHEKYNSIPFEAKNLLQILTPPQYETYLYDKNRVEAITNEKKIWTRLKQYGLTNDVDSAQTNKELVNYQLNVLVANERYHNSDSQENMELKAMVENKKPPILKKLDISVRTSSLNASSKKSLSW
jgi:hypothetical protein